MGRLRFPTALSAVIAVCVILPSGARLRGETPVLQVDTSFISTDAKGRGWVIGNDLIQYSIGDQGGQIVVRGILDPVTGRDWHPVVGPDSFATIDGQKVSIGSATTVYSGFEAGESWGGVRLDIFYRIPSASLEITRSYASYPGSSVIETWTTFHSAGAQSAKLAGLTNFAFTIKNGSLRWIRGLQVAPEDGGPFTLSTTTVDDGQTFEIGSHTRSSEQSMPWFSVLADDANTDDPAAWSPQLFGTLLWEGAWRFQAHREGSQLALQFGLPDLVTTLAPGASLEMPHAAFGGTNPVVPEVSLAMRTFIDHGIRHGRPLRADVTYNTWFTYGTFIDEATLRTEMQFAASMGIEQFVVDAGWWVNIDLSDPSNFAQGLGTWQVDPDRFPSGLGALSDYAHQLGMRFGVWVEPERVDLQTVGQPDLAEERFLATNNGHYVDGVSNGDAQTAQVCLADSAARDWLVTKLHNFLDDVHPDYLKWDNNYWINCTRVSHGHGADDGNYQHMRGLETILTELRDSYPDMDIENSASGGNRLSLGMLAYTDVGWLDDHSSPSVHVRHNLGGLSAMFPPAYLFSFVMGDVTEELIDGPSGDLSRLVRSRMGGMLGATWSAATMSEGTRTEVAKQIALYKSIRPVLQQGASILLGRQVMDYPDAPWWGWDALEHLQPSTGDAVILAFDTDDSAEDAIVKPRGLIPDVSYNVESADYGMLGSVMGADVMNDGIQLSTSGLTHSHVLIFHAGTSNTAARRRR